MSETPRGIMGLGRRLLMRLMTGGNPGPQSIPPTHQANPTNPPPVANSPSASPTSPQDKLQRFQDLVYNVLSSRQEWFNRLSDPRRDIYAECGYPAKGFIPSEFYRDLFEREAIAARVVQVFSKESWQVSPSVYESEDPTQVTKFEKAWDDLSSQLRGENSHFVEEEGSPVWEYLQRVDELSGIGQYGVLLLGLNDGEIDLSKPVKGVEELGSAPRGQDEAGNPINNQAQRPYKLTVNKEETKGRKLTFIRALPEHLAAVTQFESNPTSPRFGQPTMYLITLNDPREGQQTGIGLTTVTRNVHWTRVIHVADNLMSSEVFGVPRMRPVLNNLLGLQKLYCGSPEMYWQGAFPGWTFSTHPQLGGDVEIDMSGLKDMMEEYSNGLQRWLALMGMSAQSMAPQISDPTSQINTQLEAICIQLGIPMRVFKGSERGELASSQDDAAWNDRLRARQCRYITPRIIVPFVDRLIALGVLPEPTEGNVSSQESFLGLGPQQPGGLAEDDGGDLLDDMKTAGEEVPFGDEEDNLDEETSPEEGGEAPIESEDGEEDEGGDEVQSEQVPPGRLGQPEAGQKRLSPETDTEEPLGLDPDEELGGREDTGSDRMLGKMATPPSGEQPKAPEPIGYRVFWPDLTSQTQSEKAQVAAAKVGAMAQYISGGVEALMLPVDFLTKIMGMEEDEANSIIEKAAHQAEIKKEEQMLQQQQMIEQGLAPDPTDPEQMLAAQGLGPDGVPPGVAEGPPGAEGGADPGFPPKGPPSPPGVGRKPTFKPGAGKPPWLK